MRRYLDQRLRLSLLRVVDALETHRSLLKASAVLGISQPALAENLRELKDVLQTRLFERHSRGVRPTYGGLLFLEFARRILAEVHRLDEQLDQLSIPSGGTIALGALPVAAAGVLPGALARLKITHPDIRIRLQQGRTEDLLPLLASREIDMIVGRRTSLPRRTAFRVSRYGPSRSRFSFALGTHSSPRRRRSKLFVDMIFCCPP